jgi:hypothetical protein
MVIVTSMSLWPTMSLTMCGGTPRSSSRETQVWRTLEAGELLGRR